MTFKTGDRVHHKLRNENGTVEIATNGDVQVTFDKPAPSGRSSIGIFDEFWFQTHPDILIAEEASSHD